MRSDSEILKEIKKQYPDFGINKKYRVEDLRKIIKILPDGYDTWYEAGNYLEHLYRYDEAMYCYEQAFWRNPKNEIIRDKIHYYYH